MCGRYVLAADATDYCEFFKADRIETQALAPSYNVAPTDPVYAIAEWDQERLLGSMSWGFTPHWAPDRKGMQINARLETVAGKAMFRESFSKRRCLIPADGFYEWEPKDRGRTPHWIYRADGFPMAFAGVYSGWTNPLTEERIRTCAIITTKASPNIASIHGRMPLSLPADLWDVWLDRDLTDSDQIADMVRAIHPVEVLEHAVSNAVNSVRNNGRALTNPAETDTLF